MSGPFDTTTVRSLPRSTSVPGSMPCEITEPEHDVVAELLAGLGQGEPESLRARLRAAPTATRRRSGSSGAPDRARPRARPASPARPSAPASSVGVAGYRPLDDDAGRDDLVELLDRRSRRPDRARRAGSAPRGRVSPVDSGQLTERRTLTDHHQERLALGQLDARTAETVRTTWPDDRHLVAAFPVDSRPPTGWRAIRLRASASGISTRSGTVYTGVANSRVASTPSTASAAITSRPSDDLPGEPAASVRGSARRHDGHRSGRRRGAARRPARRVADRRVGRRGSASVAGRPASAGYRRRPMSESSGRMTRSSPRVTADRQRRHGRIVEIGLGLDDHGDGLGSASSDTGGATGGRTTPPVGSSGVRKLLDRRLEQPGRQQRERFGAGQLGRRPAPVPCRTRRPTNARRPRVARHARAPRRAGRDRPTPASAGRPGRPATATVESFLNGSVPVTASWSVRQSAYTSVLPSIGCDRPLLGRGVPGGVRRHRVGLLPGRLVEQRCEPEVGDAETAIVTEHQLRRGQLGVHETATMGVVERPACVEADRERLRRREKTSTVEHVAQTAAGRAARRRRRR